MLFPHEATKPRFFDFRYRRSPGLVMQLVDIGWEMARSPDYFWDNRHRKTEKVVLQYTLSGYGEFSQGGTSYRVGPQQAFLCSIPSESSYSLPQSSSHWEFLFFSAVGDDAFRHWHNLIGQSGPVVSLQEKPRVVQLLSGLYSDIYHHRGLSTTAISARLYEITLELHHLALEPATREVDPLDALARTLRMMEEEFAKDLSVDTLAGYANLSRFHFTRVFTKRTGMGPVEYLRKIRLEQSALLLQNSNKTVEEVALLTGFQSAQYFRQVFKEVVGMTPQEYRKQNPLLSLGFLRIED